MVSIIISRRMEWVEHAARMGQMVNGYEVLVGKLEEKRPALEIR
jgi:hypothetical protein